MTKILLSITLAVMFIACSQDKDVVYVDSKTGKPINTPHHLAVLPVEEVVCNEFGVAYYKFQGAYDHPTYTPVRSNTFGSFGVVSCKEYEDYLNKRGNQ